MLHVSLKVNRVALTSEQHHRLISYKEQAPLQLFAQTKRFTNPESSSC